MADLEKLLAEATPGPWDVDQHGIDDCMGDVWLGEEVRVCENAMAVDARLIALAPSLAAALLVAEKALHSGISFAEEWIYEHGGIEGCDYSDLRAFQSMKSALSEIEKLTGGGE